MEINLAPIIGEKNVTLKPFKFWHMLLLFFIPAAVMYFCVYVLWPYLVNQGINSEVAYVLATSVTTGGMFVASLIAYLLEGNPMNWGSFKKRFRLEKISVQGWLWAIGGLVVLLTVSAISNKIVLAIYEAIDFTPPSISPNVRMLALVIVMLSLNILGEEFWWRGYIQPRQELSFKKYTFIVHGVLWSLFHIFKWWAVPAMLIVCMVIPFIAQRTKSTIPCLILHLIQNGLGILMLLIAK